MEERRRLRKRANAPRAHNTQLHLNFVFAVCRRRTRTVLRTGLRATREVAFTKRTRRVCAGSVHVQCSVFTQTRDVQN